MKMKEIKYNIKAALFRLKNSAVKVASGVLLVLVAMKTKLYLRINVHKENISGLIWEIWKPLKTK